MKKIYYLLSFVFVISACTNKSKSTLTEWSGNIQGTTFHSKWYGNPEQIKQSSIDSIFRDFDLTASLYVDSSIICKINRGENPELNNNFITLINKSKEISLKTDGYFDITVESAGYAWGFSKKMELIPTLPLLIH